MKFLSGKLQNFSKFCEKITEFDTSCILYHFMIFTSKLFINQNLKFLDVNSKFDQNFVKTILLWVGNTFWWKIYFKMLLKLKENPKLKKKYDISWSKSKFHKNFTSRLTLEKSKWRQIKPFVSKRHQAQDKPMKAAFCWRFLTLLGQNKTRCGKNSCEEIELWFTNTFQKRILVWKWCRKMWTQSQMTFRIKNSPHFCAKYYQNFILLEAKVILRLKCVTEIYWNLMLFL